MHGSLFPTSDSNAPATAVSQQDTLALSASHCLENPKRKGWCGTEMKEQPQKAASEGSQELS